jgi:hypothetical protein
VKPDSGNDNRAGNCTDCGEPVWWHDDRLVTRNGLKWCFGKDDSHVGMTHQHALPGMPQFIVPSPLGQVCHCLARRDPHVHLIIDSLPDGALSDRDALDQIAMILRNHAGAGHTKAIAQVVQSTGRATRNRDLEPPQ